MRHKVRFLSLLAFAGALFAQGTASLTATQSFTAASTGAVIPNGPTVSGGPQGSVGFRLVYYIQAGSGTVSALSVELDGAATATGSYTALTPAPGGGSGSSPTVNPAVTSPQGQNNLCCDFYPFLHIKVNTFTVASGSPILIVKVLGYAGTSAAAGSGGGGGGLSCLNGDVSAGSGSGCTSAEVVGIENVPFCSGYAPSNGNFIQYTTGGSPSPCYSAAVPASGGTGNAASVVTYTPAASVTLTCPSTSTGTVTTFDPNGTALAANMALTFASCTTGQIVMVRVIQAASGGPFSVSGLPTGSPPLSTYASATTIYTLQASGASAMNFVNVAANSGASTLGTGANGISRTVIAGSGGVTASLLVTNDASNPSKYVTVASGGCGAGVAAYSASASGTFEIYTVPGTVLSMIADAAITAGDIVVGGTVTAGRVADSGQTSRTAISSATCIVGTALTTVASAGAAVLVAYDGAGTFGALSSTPHGTANFTISGTSIGTKILTGCITNVVYTGTGQYTMTLSGCPSNYVPVASMYNVSGITGISLQLAAYSSTSLEVYTTVSPTGATNVSQVFVVIP